MINRLHKVKERAKETNLIKIKFVVAATISAAVLAFSIYALAEKAESDCDRTPYFAIIGALFAFWMQPPYRKNKTLINNTPANTPANSTTNTAQGSPSTIV